MRITASSIVIVFVIFLIASTQTRNVSASYRPGWVSIDVFSFDGTQITARIVLNVIGNHQNGTVHIYGEDQVGEVSVSVGRYVGQVVYSTDTNITTFQYAQSFTSPQNYKVSPALFGMPLFPFDEHTFNFRIVTDFDANIDPHPTTPTLPNGNYQGLLTEIGTSRNNDYTYSFLLTLSHSEFFVLSMMLWSWGVVIILFGATTGLIRGLVRRRVSHENAVTALSGLVVFVPVYELALQPFKSPLGMTPSDILIFALLVVDVVVLIFVVQGRFSKEILSSASSNHSNGRFQQGALYVMILGAALTAVFLLAWFRKQEVRHQNRDPSA